MLHITQRPSPVGAGELGLNGCFLSITSCWCLAAVLRTNQSLTELDLGYNQYIGGSGVQLLCEGLKHPNCKSQRLGLWNCGLKGASCGYLAAVLRTSQSLTELELRDNVSLGYSGVQLLCEGLKHPNCKLQRLGLQSLSCGDLSSVFSTSQTLTELDLKNNTIRDSGVQLLCEGLKHPNCKLQKLGLSKWHVTKETQAELDAVKKIKPDLVIER
ncbi:NACHT, LRR and PYD domains-containing protein 3 [Chelonia mydas]|uniref:NACHT, LRR and PYD domains-containing protein 3 n=1 Tax=Chelonia mydas TaxID=8469 RepID=M7BL64_CHEMY|nr:NACHT, LRR and PYD domains-containing protein 3 [Chelonia mydas]